MEEKIILIPEEIGTGTFKLRGEMTRQIFDKVNRLKLQREFAYEEKNVDKIMEVDNQLQDLVLIEMVLEPKITKEQLRNNTIPFPIQEYLSTCIAEDTLTIERIQDIKKKHITP